MDTDGKNDDDEDTESDNDDENDDEEDFENEFDLGGATSAGGSARIAAAAAARSAVAAASAVAAHDRSRSGGSGGLRVCVPCPNGRFPGPESWEYHAWRVEGMASNSGKPVRAAVLEAIACAQREAAEKKAATAKATAAAPQQEAGLAPSELDAVVAKLEASLASCGVQLHKYINTSIHPSKGERVCASAHAIFDQITRKKPNLALIQFPTTN